MEETMTYQHVLGGMSVARSHPPASPWIVQPQPRPRAAMRLFCLPYAGGGAALFAPWAGALPETIELVAVQPPGRAERMLDPPHAAMASLIEALLAALAPLLDRPFALFGHSMGALVSFELARALRRAGGPAPARLIVSGHRAPQLPCARPPTHRLPEHEFLAELRRLNGTPPEVLAHHELMQLLIPLLRADFAVCETYTYAEAPPLDCPILTLGGLADAHVARADLEAWRPQTRAGFALRMLPGDHFFLNAERHLLLRLLAQELA
jgi:medium-chain acyl-[acyl-carrier-protein] hydrolase